MFATDSFLNAELAYRETRIRQDWGTRRSAKAVRKAEETTSRTPR